jgi:hypothetical protein
MAYATLARKYTLVGIQRVLSTDIKIVSPIRQGPSIPNDFIGFGKALKHEKLVDVELEDSSSSEDEEVVRI